MKVEDGGSKKQVERKLKRGREQQMASKWGTKGSYYGALIKLKVVGKLAYDWRKNEWLTLHQIPSYLGQQLAPF